MITREERYASAQKPFAPTDWGAGQGVRFFLMRLWAAGAL